jgi:flagellar L-ring protein precursor FlgH
MEYDGSTSSGGGNLEGSLDFKLGNTSKRTFQGNSQLTSDRRFIDRITVTVVDILPNGNLVVEGYRSRVVAGEERVLRITGIVRPADIAQSNIVQSQFVANFKVSYLGRGPQSSYVNQGYFSRALNILWPW